MHDTYSCSAKPGLPQLLGRADRTGPYCAQCGQHAHESARSLHTLIYDAWHLVTHLDGRLWSTLVLLLFKPGRLTREYFADHRTRTCTPPCSWR
jgi:hypothetical protein